jgi:O-acetyl-ADP-ribose deacetylase (regulator of RNase III)
LAAAESLSSISFPSISTGAFGYPKDEAAGVSSKVLTELLNQDDRIRTVRLVFFSDPDMQMFLEHCRFID